MGSLRLLLASDYALPRAGLRLLLESVSGFVVVGEIDQAGLLSEQIKLVQPNVVVMAVSPRSGFGTSLIESLAQEHRALNLVAIWTHDESSFVRLLISAGVRGYVCDQSPPLELFQAIREAAQGRIYIDSLVSSRTDQESLSKVKVDGPRRPAFLSRRETDVLKLLARGFTNQQVADSLVLSVKTAETYRVRLTRKLGVKTRSELFNYAFEVGMVDLNDLTKGQAAK
ncbi:MAG: response regulator transcription factor [Planctomycetia bacterium]|nr:response regulator transcription factor [Planctomycetia bacterium]